VFIARTKFLTVITDASAWICIIHALFAVFALYCTVGVLFLIGGLFEAVFIAPPKSAGDVAWVFVTEAFVKTF
jgi:hypothetical protein